MPRRPAAGRFHAAGFTLIELAIVLCIVAVLLRVAAPGLSRPVAARALAVQASEFMAALRLARSEAFRRGVAVTVCARRAEATTPACQGGGPSDWRAGWIVFADRQRTASPGGLQPLLRLQPPLQHSGGVAGTRGSISFTAAGYSTDGASHYLFSPPAEAAGDAPPPVMVCVSKQGRPRLAAGGSCD